MKLTLIFVVTGLIWINYPETAYSFGAALLSIQSSEVHNTNAMKTKEEKTEYMFSYYRTKTGIIRRIRNNQINTSKRRGHPAPNYSAKELETFAFSSDEFNRLYDDWVESDYKNGLSPSFDRANDYLPYTLDNFNAWMTWDEHKIKSRKDIVDGINNKKSTPIIGIPVEGGQGLYFHSERSASRAFTADRNNATLRYALDVKHGTAYGHYWRRIKIIE